MANEYKWFTLDEFKCTETGENNIRPEFVRRLDDLRDLVGFPLSVTSGFRSVTHSREVNKPNGPGQHTNGIAADFRVADGRQRRMIIECALSMGFKGIGVAKTFVHVDDREGQPVLWTY